MSYRFFSEDEFNRCFPSCSLSDMDEEFMNKLETARSYAQLPFHITSAFRSVDYERKNNRSGSSSHCKGCAVDISCRDSWRRLIIVQSLLRAGFRRIGIHEFFIHVDSDYSKSDCIWLYQDGKD